MSVRSEITLCRVARCRVCGSSELERVIDLGDHPLADRFVPPDAPPDALHPLTVALCHDCGYAGLEHVVSPEVRYREAAYSYTAGNSRVSREHFAELATEVSARLGIVARDLVVDIGGNDGTLLREFRRAADCMVLNVEPAPNIAALSRDAGTWTAEAFWCHEIARYIQDRGGAALITTTNTFNHATDPTDFVAAVAAALRPGGWFVFEVPSLRQLVKRRAFDTIYLEHVSYFGLRPLLHLLGTNGFGVEFATENDYMGGSIRVYARSGGGRHAAYVLDMAADEDCEGEHGIYDARTYAALRDAVWDFRDRLVSRLVEINRAGGVVVGVGAAAKGNTLLNYCGIDRELLVAVADASPLKIGKLTPGSRLPIVADADIPAAATHALILPWNLADYLRGQLEREHPGLEIIVPTMETQT